MTDHAHELRRYARKIGHPAGDVPAVMLAAADEIERLQARVDAAEKERDWNAERLEDAIEELTALRAELETERMRLAACGVVALSNTPDSAKQARDMLPEYWSASCGDVARMVDENIRLRAKIEAMEQQKPVAYLPLSSAHMLESSAIANGVVWNCRDKAASDMPLYALPGAHPATSETGAKP